MTSTLLRMNLAWISCLVAAAAYGQGASTPPGATKPSKQAAPPTGPPKPSPELEKLKPFEGTWTCNGTAPAGAAGPGSPAYNYKSTWKFKRDLDGFWWLADYEQKKAKGMPIVVKARGYMGYDPTASKYIIVGVDNLSSYLVETATFDGERVSASGDGAMMGQKISFRESFQFKGKTQFTWKGELKMDQDFVTVGEETCKK